MGRQLDFEQQIREAQMYQLWCEGKHCGEIAAALGMTELRVIHELNIVLNEKAGFFGLSDGRQTTDPDTPEAFAR